MDTHKSRIARTIGICIALAAAAFSIAAVAIHRVDDTRSTAESRYRWVEAIPSGRSCWPDCLPGQWCWPKACAGRDQWPSAIVPVAAFGKLWMIGNQFVWSSADGIHWSQANSDATWGERYGMAGSFFNGRFWKAGGMHKSWDDFRNDVWSSANGIGWKLATAKANWSARRGHTMLVFNDRLWVLGGAESSGRHDQLPSRKLSDVWSSRDGILWTNLTSNAPWSGNVNSVVFRNEIWVIGDGGAWHSADGKTWPQAIANAAWLERGGNGAAGCLVFDGKIWMFGGLTPNGTVNDIWNTSDGVHWQQVTPAAPWSPRGAENSVVFQNKLWIFGGKTGGPEDGYSGNVWWMSSD